MENLTDSRRLRGALAEELDRGTLTADDLEIALHHPVRKEEQEASEEARQVYARVLAVARSCPGWTEPRN